MRFFVSLVIIFNLVLNLLSPYAAFLSGSANQQALCSISQDNWTDYQKSEQDFIQTGLALGFSKQQIKEFGLSNQLAAVQESSSQTNYHSGHCPLCHFEPLSLDYIVASEPLAPRLDSNSNPLFLSLTLFFNKAYLRPHNKAPPLFFVS